MFSEFTERLNFTVTRLDSVDTICKRKEMKTSSIENYRCAHMLHKGCYRQLVKYLVAYNSTLRKSGAHVYSCSSLTIEHVIQRIHHNLININNKVTNISCSDLDSSVAISGSYTVPARRYIKKSPMSSKTNRGLHVLTRSCEKLFLMFSFLCMLCSKKG